MTKIWPAGRMRPMPTRWGRVGGCGSPCKLPALGGREGAWRLTTLRVFFFFVSIRWNSLMKCRVDGMCGQWRCCVRCSLLCFLTFLLAGPPWLERTRKKISPWPQPAFADLACDPSAPNAAHDLISPTRKKKTWNSTHNRFIRIHTTILFTYTLYYWQHNIHFVPRYKNYYRASWQMERKVHFLWLALVTIAVEGPFVNQWPQ